MYIYYLGVVRNLHEQFRRIGGHINANTHGHTHLILKPRQVHRLGHALTDDVDFWKAVLTQHAAEGELNGQDDAVHAHHVMRAMHFHTIGRDLWFGLRRGGVVGLRAGLRDLRGCCGIVLKSDGVQ